MNNKPIVKAKPQPVTNKLPGSKRLTKSMLGLPETSKLILHVDELPYKIRAENPTPATCSCCGKKVKNLIPMQLPGVDHFWHLCPTCISSTRPARAQALKYMNLSR